MAKGSKRRVRTVAIFVIFLALAYAGVTAVKDRGSGPDYNAIFKESNQQFRDAGSLNKAMIKLRSLNIGKALEEMNDYVKSYSYNNETPLRKDRKGSYGVYIFKVDGARFPELLKKFSAMGGIEEQKEIVDSALVVKKLATEQAILDGKRNELASMDNLGSVYGDVSVRKNVLISEIRDLEHTVDLLTQSNTTLLYVQLVPTMGGNSLSIVKKFVYTFLISIIVLFVAVVLAYFGTKLLMYLMGLMGIKGFNATNLGGNYNYGGYGGYSNRYYSRQGYGKSKRKVKRVYKGKSTTPREDGSEETESK